MGYSVYNFNAIYTRRLDPITSRRTWIVILLLTEARYDIAVDI